MRTRKTRIFSPQKRVSVLHREHFLAGTRPTSRRGHRTEPRPRRDRGQHHRLFFLALREHPSQSPRGVLASERLGEPIQHPPGCQGAPKAPAGVGSPAAGGSGVCLLGSFSPHDPALRPGSGLNPPHHFIPLSSFCHFSLWLQPWRREVWGLNLGHSCGHAGSSPTASVQGSNLLLPRDGAVAVGFLAQGTAVGLGRLSFLT